MGFTTGPWISLNGYNVGTSASNTQVIDSSGNITADITGNVTGNVTGDVTGNLTGQVFGTVSTYVADGAIALTDNKSLLDGTSATVAATLAAGTAGQTIAVKAIDITNAVTLVPASFADGTTITFNTQYDSVVLFSDGTNWYLESNNGAAIT